MKHVSDFPLICLLAASAKEWVFPEYTFTEAKKLVGAQEVPPDFVPLFDLCERHFAKRYDVSNFDELYKNLDMVKLFLNENLQIIKVLNS